MNKQELINIAYNQGAIKTVESANCLTFYRPSFMPEYTAFIDAYCYNDRWYFIGTWEITSIKITP